MSDREAEALAGDELARKFFGSPRKATGGSMNDGSTSHSTVIHDVTGARIRSVAAEALDNGQRVLWVAATPLDARAHIAAHPNLKRVGVGQGLAGYPADLVVLDNPNRNNIPWLWDWWITVGLCRMTPGSSAILRCLHGDPFAALLLAGGDGRSWSEND